MKDKAPEIKKWNVLATAFWLSFSIVWVVIAIYAATRSEPQPAIPLDPCLSCHASYGDIIQLVGAESEERGREAERERIRSDKMWQKANESITVINEHTADLFDDPLKKAHIYIEPLERD